MRTAGRRSEHVPDVHPVNAIPVHNDLVINDGTPGS